MRQPDFPVCRFIFHSRIQPNGDAPLALALHLGGPSLIVHGSSSIARRSNAMVLEGVDEHPPHDPGVFRCGHQSKEDTESEPGASTPRTRSDRDQPQPTQHRGQSHAGGGHNTDDAERKNEGWIPAYYRRVRRRELLLPQQQQQRRRVPQQQQQQQIHWEPHTWNQARKSSERVH